MGSNGKLYFEAIIKEEKNSVQWVGKGGNFGGVERSPEKVTVKLLHKGVAGNTFDVGGGAFSFWNVLSFLINY